MKVRALLLSLGLVAGPSMVAFGQVSCLSSNKLVCAFPASASIVGASALGPSEALKIGQPVAGAINSSIGTQLTQLPIPSASVGTVSLQAAGNPFGVPFDNLGPILTDRPDTVGRHRFFLGFNYQHFHFNSIDGNELGSLTFGYQAANNTAGSAQTIYGSESARVNFTLDQYVALATYGVTRTTDVTVVVPLTDVALKVKSANFQTYLYDTTSGQYSNESLPAGTIFNTHGSASGVGDVIVSVKQMLLGQEGRRPAVAVGGDFRFPTGDSLNYLGSGAYGFNLHGLFEYRWKIAPHLKMAYQWNTNSQLVNIFAAPNTQLPGGVQYDAGGDYRVLRSLTLAVDFLGSQFVNSQSLKKATVNLMPTPPTNVGIASSIRVLNAETTTYTTANFSGGVKWRPHNHWILYANVLVPINNVGLRSNPVPMFGMSFNR